MKTHNKNYDKPVKQAWRFQIWDYWRQYSSLQQIPKDKQYWTLGDRTIKEGREAGELHAIQQYGLLEDLSSFYSVNFEKEKADDNLPHCRVCGKYLKEHPKDHDYIYSTPWHSLLGDIEQLVPIFYNEGRFNPSFVNLDTTHFSTDAFKLANKVGRYCPSGSLLAVNMIYGRFNSRVKPESSISEYKQYRYLTAAKFHDPGIRYQSINCHLATVFLEF
jgi:hypothetical protein